MIDTYKFTSFLITLIIIYLLWKLRKYLMGNDYSNLISKDAIKDKIIIIFSNTKTNMIKELSKTFTDNEASLIVVSSDNIVYTDKKSTNFVLDTSDLDEVLKFTNYINKYIFKIDLLIYNSMELAFKTTDKKKGDPPLIEKRPYHKLFIHNTLTYFLILIKLLPALDRGEGRVINIIGDAFHRSDLRDFMHSKFETNHKNFKKIDQMFVNYENSKNDLNFLYKKCGKDSKVENIYSNSSLINIYILKFFKEFSEVHQDNIIINCITPGIYLDTFLDYCNQTVSGKIIYLFYPLVYFAAKNTKWIVQPIYKLIFRNYVEIMNGGLYDKNSILAKTSISAKDENARKIFVKLLLYEIKDILNEDEFDKINRSIGEIKEHTN